MGRAKNKKPNAASGAKTPASAPQQPQRSSPAASANRAMLPSPPRTRSASPETTEILDVLRPYEQLLPALRGVKLPVQQRLHRALYTAGCTAAEALETYLKDKSLALKQLEGGDASTTTSSESEELRLLLNYVSVEMAAENLRKVCSGPDGKILLRDAENKILNEVAAAALAAFAAAASRRPSTKHVEYLMNPTASMGAADDAHSQSSQLTGVVAAAVSERTASGRAADAKGATPVFPPVGQLPVIPALDAPTAPLFPAPDVVPPPPPAGDSQQQPHADAPYPRAVNTSSTGTNTSAGYLTPIGKLSRKRPAPHPVRRERADVTVDTSGDEMEELDEEEDDYSDAELDDESECNTADHLDASRHSDTPIEDFDYTDALLRFACTVGHVDIVKWLVEIRGCPEYQSAHKSTMLMEACCAGQTKVVQALLDQEADVNAVSDSQNTALIYAATAGKLECVRQLLHNPDIEIDKRNQSGHTALMEASSAGHLEIVEELLQHGADIFAIVENVDFKESSLSLASYRGHVEVVSALLRAMPECPERMEELHAGLLEAAMDGHVDVARVLLDGGAPVNLPTENFESPLTLAACGGHYDLVQLLVEKNADLEEPNDEGYTPLMEAAREGHQDVVELLLDNGANVNSKIEEGIETPLTLAASGGYLRIVEMLVSHGGDLSVGERTPLYEATQEGHVDVVKFILKQLKKNADKPEVIEDLNNALVSAAETNNMELIKLFLENGAQISCFSKEGRTPLMEAAKQGHLDVIEYLVNRGACVNVVSPTNDATALSLACLFGRAEVTKYLLKKGANAEVMLKDSVSCIIEASRNGNTDCARIVLDHMGVKGKEAHGKKSNGTISDIPMAKPSELSQRPKIKPVHKLQNQQQREPITQTVGTISVHKIPAKQAAAADVQQQQPQPVCTCNDHPPPSSAQQQPVADLTSLLTQKMSPEWAAAASGIKGPILPANGPSAFAAAGSQGTTTKTSGQSTLTISKQRGAPPTATVTTTTKQRHPAGGSATTTTTTATITATPVDPQNAAEIFQQFPAELMSSMMAAAANASISNSANANAMAVDESMLAHFFQRSLIEPKRRDASWTDQELAAFKDLVRQKMRTLNPAAMTSPSLTTSVQPQQITDLIDEHQEFMVANMLSGANLVGLNAEMGECPGCAHQHAAQYASSVHSKLGNAPPPNVLPAAGGSGGRSVADSLANTTSILSAIQNARSGVDDEMDRLSRAAVDQSGQPPLKRKGSAIKARPAATSTSSDTSGAYAGQRVSGIRRNSTSRRSADSPVITVKVKQKLAETSELLRSKLDAISMDVSSKTAASAGATEGGAAAASLEDAMQKIRELSAHVPQQPPQLPAALPPAQLPTLPPLPSTTLPNTTTGTSVIQSPVYYNRTLTGTGGASALTPEQQQQIIFYQQQEYHNLQNIQTAAGHHHVTSTTGSFQSATPCHPGAHVHPVAAAAAQMSNLGQQMQQASNRAARRTTQSGKHPKTCTGHGANGHALNGVAYGDFQSDPEGAKLHADDYRDDVSSYVDVQTDQNNDTALTVACVGGHASLVSLLIQRGANVEHRDKKGFTPLILAATGGHVDCCKLLIEAGCVIDAQSERTKDTALSLACSGGRKEVVELLLRFGANKEHRNVSDYTPLSLAASGGYVDIIHLLLDAGAEINSRTGSKLGISPLMLAAMNGHDAATLMLLERGSDINAQIETNRNTALTLACFQGRTEVVRLLLKFGANVEHRAKTGLTPLMEAANGGYTDVGALLLKAGADPNASPVPTSRDTALTIAADKGHSTFVSMLLNQQAFIDVKNKKGCTPLFLACGNGHLETVKILVKRRADVDALDNRKTSPLVAAFRKGFVKVVEFMVQHVNQFPNDLECARYYNNLSDGDLAAKVKECLDVIMDAKAKQAEQANRAAESLLEQLAEEEALAESKKQSKKRLKEKKKAKKLAKRAAEVDDDEAAEEAQIEEEEADVAPAKENRPAVPAVEVETPPPAPPPAVVAPEAPVADQPPAMSKSQLKKAKQAAARAANAAAALAAPAGLPSKEQTPEEPPAIVVEDPRVPQTFNEVPSANETNGPLKTAATNGKESGSRRQNRRGRGEKDANGQPSAATSSSRISIQPNATIMTSPQHSPNVTAKSSSSYSTNAGNNSAEESEWLSASKRRASSRPGKETATASTTATNVDRSSSSKDPLRDLVRVMKENPQVSEAWSMTEPNSKRRAFAITVSSSTVARIIGRAGQNINAIREATNAHIEVEKIATRREQSTRQITVKGSPDSIRNAITMMDLLVRDSDAHVNDVIRRVTRTDVVSSSPATVAGAAPVVLPPMVALDKKEAAAQSAAAAAKQPSTTPPATSYASFQQPAVRSTSSTSSAGASTTPTATSSTATTTSAATATTNVWQQRAAIRKMQQTSETPAPTAAQPSGQPPSASTSASASPVPHSAASFSQPAAFNAPPTATSEQPLDANAEAMAATNAPDSAHDFALQLEELKRKAPGFERPSAQPTPIKAAPASTDSRVDEISALLTGAGSESGLGFPFGGGDQTKFLSGFLNDAPPSSVAPSAATAANVRVGSADGSERAAQRPLSEIWNTPSATSASNLADDTGFAGLFGADSKNAASLWLPPSSSSSAGVKDDTWLDSAALFSSLGIGEMGGGNAPSVAPIGSKSAFGSQSTGAARPHSSTDWTASGSPWASSGMFGGPPSAQQQQQLGTAHWSTATSQAMSNGPPGVISPPKTSALSSSGGRLLSGAAIARPAAPSVSSAASSTRMPANWQAVFNQMAQQLGDVAEKEKQQKAAAAAAQANVYAPYATAAMDDRLQFNGLMRAAGGMTATEQPPQPSMGGIAPPHSVAATPQAANHSAVIKSYLESMPKDFDLNLSALSNSEQLRQSFYAAQMAAHQQQQQPAGVFGQPTARGLPPMGAPLAPTAGGAPSSGVFIQPPPGFGAMPPAPRASSMTPVQQLPPLPNGNAAAAAAGWSSQQPAAAYGSAAAFDSMWKQRR